jgi:phage shock protein PspC (stress-responsive transcriptional regulator)
MAHFHGLTRDLDDRWIAGVCSGLGKHTQVPAWVYRLLFVLSCLCGIAVIVGWVGIVAIYVCLAVFIPPESSGDNDPEQEPQQ